jgi:diaphanous 1
VSRSPTVITHISYAIHNSSLKVYALVCELLAAICIVSPADGHKAVLSAFSDFRVAYEENFRFETLLSSLHLPD